MDFCFFIYISYVQKYIRYNFYTHTHTHTRAGARARAHARTLNMRNFPYSKFIGCL